MGCKVQSIWHIWTVLLAPLCKAPAFFTQLCRNTDHNVWNVLILSEVFNNFLFYILHILHFLFQNSLCSCLFSPPSSRGLCSAAGPRRTEVEVPSSRRPAPRGCCRNARHPGFPRGGRAAGPWQGHGQDTRQAAAPWAALQTLYSCFLHGIPKKVMCLSPGDESTFWDTRIKLHCTWTARLNRVLRRIFFFFFLFLFAAKRKYECMHL